MFSPAPKNTDLVSDRALPSTKQAPPGTVPASRSDCTWVSMGGLQNHGLRCLVQDAPRGAWSIALDCARHAGHSVSLECDAEARLVLRDSRAVPPLRVVSGDVDAAVACLFERAGYGETRGSLWYKTRCLVTVPVSPTGQCPAPQGFSDGVQSALRRVGELCRGRSPSGREHLDFELRLPGIPRLAPGALAHQPLLRALGRAARSFVLRLPPGLVMETHELWAAAQCTYAALGDPEASLSAFFAGSERGLSATLVCMPRQESAHVAHADGYGIQLVRTADDTKTPVLEFRLTQDFFHPGLAPHLSLAGGCSAALLAVGAAMAHDWPRPWAGLQVAKPFASSCQDCALAALGALAAAVSDRQSAPVPVCLLHAARIGTRQRPADRCPLWQPADPTPRPEPALGHDAVLLSLGAAGLFGGGGGGAQCSEARLVGEALARVVETTFWVQQPDPRRLHSSAPDDVASLWGSPLQSSWAPVSNRPGRAEERARRAGTSRQ